jgi:hypothetical protein
MRPRNRHFAIGVSGSGTGRERQAGATVRDRSSPLSMGCGGLATHGERAVRCTGCEGSDRQARVDGQSARARSRSPGVRRAMQVPGRRLGRCRFGRRKLGLRRSGKRSLGLRRLGQRGWGRRGPADITSQPLWPSPAVHSRHGAAGLGRVARGRTVNWDGRPSAYVRPPLTLSASRPGRPGADPLPSHLPATTRSGARSRRRWCGRPHRASGARRCPRGCRRGRP